MKLLSAILFSILSLTFASSVMTSTGSKKAMGRAKNVAGKAKIEATNGTQESGSDAKSKSTDNVVRMPPGFRRNGGLIRKGAWHLDVGGCMLPIGSGCEAGNRVLDERHKLKQAWMKNYGDASGSQP